MIKQVLLLLFLPLLQLTCCNTPTEPEDENGNINDEPPIEVNKEVDVTIDKSKTFQTIDGFGFFGAEHVWWGSEEDLFSRGWADKIIRDLGITIWRNEYFPPHADDVTQDADWEKQRPVVEGIAGAADRAGVDLKMIFSVWSPPADMKIAISEDGNHLPGSGGKERYINEPHSDGTKHGGTLSPEKYEEFGDWLADGVGLYEELGIDIHAISPQNEPMFEQVFNSCFYRVDWYAEMLENSMPVVRARYPDIKIFGSENMLEMEGGNDRRWFYHWELMNQQPAALDELDIWAVHGYADGVAPTEASRASRAWRNHYEDYAEPTGKKIWMTETSGFHNHWGMDQEQNGALDLGLAIHSALYHGNASAWVWWQGSELGDVENEFALMAGADNPGKKYYVSRQFYRFIRPGAVRVELDYDEQEGVFASAYYHEEMNTFTIVAINTNEEDNVGLNLMGDDLPANFKMHVTSANENSVDYGNFEISEVVLPQNSIVTLVQGNVFEHE